MLQVLCQKTRNSTTATFGKQPFWPTRARSFSRARTDRLELEGKKSDSKAQAEYGRTDGRTDRPTAHTWPPGGPVGKEFDKGFTSTILMLITRAHFAPVCHSLARLLPPPHTLQVRSRSNHLLGGNRETDHWKARRRRRMWISPVQIGANRPAAARSCQTGSYAHCMSQQRSAEGPPQVLELFPTK